MAIKNYREYRTIELTEFKTIEQDSDEPSYIVEGYATTFDQPYVLWRDGKNEFKEQIDRHALDEADMKDVVFLFNHEGMVFARTKNQSVELSLDDHGLKVRANLGLTQAAREMYETIKAGLVDAMSWAFTVDEDKFNEKTYTRTITKVRKMFDVSAVTFPANPATEIATRSYIDGEIERMRAERLELEKAKLALEIDLAKET